MCVVWVGGRALAAKDALQRAQGELTTFKSALGQPNAPSTTDLYRQLSANTGKAADEVHDPVWSAFEGIPFLGPNLKAFRQTAALTDALVRNGVQPIAVAANGLSVDSLKPKGGGIDIEPLKKLTPAMASLDDAIRTADASAGRIDTKDVVSQLQKPITSLRATLRKAMPVTAELRKVMPVLYPALGGSGTRHYILEFQNNAEERAQGGAPNAIAMLNVSHGRLKLGTQSGSAELGRNTVKIDFPLGKDWDKLYSDYVSESLNNSTFTPDFPTQARLVRLFWQARYGGKVDGVISIDPIALSYLMRATGPIKLPTGEVLTSQNAVSYLLSGVYAKYTRPSVQDVVFASAAQAIFKAVTSGQGSPKGYVQQLTPMLNDQRLKAWSARSDEEALLLTSPAGNMLPADNSKSTTIGVYNNDDATSKMSYYMDATVSAQANYCAAAPTYSVSTTVTDTLKPSQIAGLTAYVLAGQPRIVPGGDRQWVNIYGPVGSKLVSASVDGVKVQPWGSTFQGRLNTVHNAYGMDDNRPAVHGNLYGRPVAIISIKMGPLESRTVKATFSGGTAPSKTLQISHTPKVHPVPVTIQPARCS